MGEPIRRLVPVRTMGTVALLTATQMSLDPTSVPPTYRNTQDWTTEMTHGSEQRSYSDDEIEQILGMGVPEAKLALKEMREIVREDPLLITGLVFAFGILLGISLCRARRS